MLIGVAPMPTYARCEIVIEDTVGVYHCIARCVRGAFLCGTDPYTERLKRLGQATQKARTGNAVLTSIIRPGKLRGSVKRGAFGLGQLP